VKAIILNVLVVFILLIMISFWQLYFSSRPPMATEAITLEGDGSLIDYCQLPDLIGNGLMARDIPKGNTPECAYDHFPLPILAQCTEPLSAQVDDLRGLWQAVSGKVGHVERVEQCGDRIVITSAGIIHDAGPNSSAGLTTNDTEGSVLFTLGNREFCSRSTAGVSWDEKVVKFRVFGWGPVVVRRYMDKGQLVWEYIDGSKTRMERICQLPEKHKRPRPRGPRYKIW
jgi:hypothetical protein